MADLESGGEEFAEDLTARGNLVASAGEVDFDYSVGVLSIAEKGTSCAIIAVAEVDSSLLVAVPAEAWHKKVRQRYLPQQALRKAVKVVVPLCAADNRTAAAGEPSLQIWLGLLARDLEDQVSFDMGAPDMAFPDLPYAGAMVAVAGDHFSFVTAESELPQEKLESRFAALEKQMSEVLGALKKEAPAAAKTQIRPPALRKAAVPSVLAETPPGLDPGVAHQAMQAGVSRKALEEMASLMHAPRHGLPPPAPRQPDVHFEDDDEEPFELEESGGQGQDPVGTAVLQMSKILAQMHKDKQKIKDRSLEGILDYAESGSASSTSGGTSKSKAAALRSLQRMLVERPALIAAEVEKAMQLDWERSGQMPGVAAGGVTARGWLEHRSRVQNYPSTVRMAWMIAGILDALRCDKIAEAKARSYLALAALDQQAVDKGSWLLASEVTLEPVPPFHSFSLHRAPEPWEAPHSLLVDPRWCELFMTKLKDISDFQEKKGKLSGYQSRANAAEPPPGPRAEPEAKKKGKATGKGKQDGKGKESQQPAPSQDQTQG